MKIIRDISSKRKRQCTKLVNLSKDIIRETFERFKYEEIGVTWTGGKDSGLCLWLIRKVCKENNLRIPKTMIIGEGDEFEEIYSAFPSYVYLDLFIGHDLDQSVYDIHVELGGLSF